MAKDVLKSVVMFSMPHHSLATELFVKLEQFLSLNILLSQMVTFAQLVATLVMQALTFFSTNLVIG